LIEVRVPGLHATVQDAGRTRHLRLGVPTAGAADRLAHAVANALVGNAPGEAALEISGLPFVFVAEQPLLAAVCGRGVRLVARDAISGWTCAFLRSGAEVRVEGNARYAYVALAGGVDVPPVLGSRSAYPAAALGPAPLAAGQRVRVRRARLDPARAGLTAEAPDYEREAVRVVLGPHDDRVDVAAFLGARFTVDERSDRMGVRLRGPRITTRAGELLTTGMTEGAVQVPPGGEPIVLLADHQTTGGYPVAATVIAADVPIVAQRHPGEALRFVAVDDDAAVAALQLVRRAVFRLLEPSSD
jgi:biotin-dependent carboxylase-like uncharacterized protein